MYVIQPPILVIIAALAMFRRLEGQWLWLALALYALSMAVMGFFRADYVATWFGRRGDQTRLEGEHQPISQHEQRDQQYRPFYSRGAGKACTFRFVRGLESVHDEDARCVRVLAFVLLF